MTARARSPDTLKTTNFRPYQDVDNFVNTEEVAIWPCKLPSFHRQLKNYISTATKDIVYYVSSNDVYAIHIPTNRQELVATIGFNPTCLASGHGWLCIGGFNAGTCAFIDLRSCPPFGLPADDTSAEVDELLPLDLDVTSRLGGHSHSSTHDRSHRRRPKIIQEEIGTVIVNGITIAKFTSEQEHVPEEIVAVVANNDKTVTIYSLSKQTTIKTINLSKEINHASISPDGEWLVAVGDVNKVWFYKRRLRNRPHKDSIYDWNEAAVVRLVSSVQNDWCFTTAWSPSGHVCMVASQFGTVTVFETSKISVDMSNTDAIAYTLKSSRPNVTDPHTLIPGAPRSMAFSPHPWDLVAWAEDHGRVTIADLRDGFSSRQTINVDINSDKLEHIVYSIAPTAREIEQARDSLFIQRHRHALESNDPEAAVRHAAEYMEDAATRRRYRTPIYAGGAELPHSVLSDSERELIELVRTENARDNMEEASSARPYSINYANRSLGSGSSQGLTFGQFIQNRADNRHSASWTTPRRRGSIVMSQHAPEQRATRTSSANPSSLTPGDTAHLSASPSRLSDNESNDQPAVRRTFYDQPATRETYHLPPIDPDQRPTTASQRSTEYYRPRHPRITSETLRTSLTRGNERAPTTEQLLRWRMITSTGEASAEALDTAESDRELREQARTWGRRIHELRERADQLSESFSSIGNNDDMSFLDEVTSDIVLGRATISRARATIQRLGDGSEVSIQGLGWSWDGRYLIVGTEQGIIRYKVNIPARMRLPALYVQ